ncbi:MAG TPA: hypothetical protein VN253_02215 [Kofleriaceae bacterium]|nr:hypothetical protein [Kofleriaceae bacterium]
MAGLDVVVDRRVDHGVAALELELAAVGVEQVAEVGAVAVVDVRGQQVLRRVAHREELTGRDRDVVHHVGLLVRAVAPAVHHRQAAQLERVVRGVVDLDPLLALVAAGAGVRRLEVGEHLGDDQVTGEQGHLASPPRLRGAARGEGGRDDEHDDGAHGATFARAGHG